MAAYLLFFAIGIVVLLVSAEYLVKISSQMWTALKVSPLIIGSTVVAVGTSLPELAVSVIASAKGDQGLAVGNIIGSSIVNIFLILGIGVLLGNINIGIKKTQRNASFLVAATLVYLLLAFSPISPKLSGIILISSAIIFSWFEVRLGIAGRDHEDKTFVNSNRKCKLNTKTCWLFLFSLFGVAGGGFLTVYSVEKISFLSGYSTTVLGFSLAAIATSLPELLTIIFCRRKDQGKIAIGSILGSNIYNLLFIGGIINLLSPHRSDLGQNLYILAFATFCAVVLIFYYAGRKVPKKIGAVLLIFFFIYLLWLKRRGG